MDRFEMFKILMAMASADNKFTAGEVEFLALRSHRWGLTDEQVTEALELAKTGTTPWAFPETQQGREKLLQDLLEVMAADGELAPVEKTLYAHAAAAMGVSAEDLNQRLDQWL